jgi:hypothetical protein
VDVRLFAISVELDDDKPLHGAFTDQMAATNRPLITSEFGETESCGTFNQRLLNRLPVAC